MSKYWEWFLLLYWTFWLFSAETFYRQYHLQPAFFCPMLNLPPGVLTGTVFFRDIPVDCKCITDISTDSTAAVTLSPSGEDLNQQKNTHTCKEQEMCYYSSLPSKLGLSSSDQNLLPPPCIFRCPWALFVSMATLSTPTFYNHFIVCVRVFFY